MTTLLEDIEFYVCWFCLLFIPYNLLMWLIGWVYIKFFYRSSGDSMVDLDRSILAWAMPMVPALLFFRYLKKYLAK